MKIYDAELTVSCIENVVSVHTTERTPTSYFTYRKFYGLAYKVSGHAVYKIADRYYDSKAGTAIFLPKGITYEVHYLEPGECIAINFDVLQEIEIDAHIVTCKGNTILHEKFRKLLTEWKKRNNDTNYKCFSIFYDIFYLVTKAMRSQYIPASKSAKFESVKSYIQEHFTESSINLAEISSACGISEVYIRKLFCEILHVSPIQYITFLRINYAKDLLSCGESVSQVALKVGYEDTFYFSKRFHKEVGVSPSAYRGEHFLV